MKGGQLLYEVAQLPTLQNRVYGSKLEARTCLKGDVRLIEDPRTGLVYNETFRPELMLYDAGYNNEQAISPYFQAHLRTMSKIVGQHLGRKGIVEIGCGKGYFLEMLTADGFDVIGFDPTYDGHNPRVRKEYFKSIHGSRCDGFVLRHVLEHIQNPVEFLFTLKEENDNAGKIYIEVPCFDWICLHGAWFDIFYEHVNYFRLSDFYRMFGTLEVAERSFGGQYLSIVADLRRLRRPEIDAADRVNFPDNFAASLRPHGTGPTAIWGARSKGVIFALLMERLGVEFNFVIDINFAKQGRYLPGTGLRISSPTEALKQLEEHMIIYVMNSNYLSEIKELSQNRFVYVTVDV